MALNTLQPISVFITGANRGIGLELVKQFIKLPKPPQHVIATYRNPDKSQGLLDLAAHNVTLHAIQYDVTDYKSLPNVIQQVNNITEYAGTSLVINNAGMGYYAGLDYDVTPEAMRSAFETNTIAPLMMTKACLPLLKKAAVVSTERGLSCNKAAIINVTSQKGSCTENVLSGYYPYRTSKAALNMVTKNCALDMLLHGILVICIHPGSVITDMGGPNAVLSTHESVQGMLQVMAAIQEKDTGKLIDYQGQEIPW